MQGQGGLDDMQRHAAGGLDQAIDDRLGHELGRQQLAKHRGRVGVA